jgi:hypothetical protein
MDFPYILLIKNLFCIYQSWLLVLFIHLVLSVSAFRLISLLEFQEISPLFIMVFLFFSKKLTFPGDKAVGA